MSEFSLPAVPYQTDDEIIPLVAEQIQGFNEPHTATEARFPFVVETRAVTRYVAEATVEGYQFLSDEPREGGGTGVAPAPLRYYVAGILLCLEVWIIKTASQTGAPIESLQTRAVSYREVATDEEAPLGRGFAWIEVTVRIDTSWEADRDDDVLAVVAGGLRGCPAAVTTSRATDLEVTVVHNGQVLDEKVTLPKWTP